MTQITNLKGTGRPGGCVSAANNALYFGWQGEIRELNLETLEERVLFRETAVRGSPRMLIRGRANPTADGKYVCVMLMEDQPEDKPAISFSYSRFREFFHLKPLTQIARIEVATGEMEVIHEDRRYMGHVNTSPTLPEILTYCHEGPWNWIDQRIWGLNIQTGETWKVRPQEGDYSIGHEYWFADGIHIGYHGRPRDESGRHVFGHIKWDNSEWVEDHFPFHSSHGTFFRSMMALYPFLACVAVYGFGRVIDVVQRKIRRQSWRSIVKTAREAGMHALLLVYAAVWIASLNHPNIQGFGQLEGSGRDGLTNPIRQCLGLISTRERELADEAGVAQERPYYTDDKPSADVVSISTIKKKTD